LRGFTGSLEKKTAATSEGITTFKGVEGITTMALDPFQRQVDRQITEDQEIRAWCDGLIALTNLLRVKAARALVCNGTEIVAIGDDDSPSIQGGLNALGDVLSAVLEKEGEFFVWVEATCLRRFTEATAKGTVGGFTR